MKAEIYYGTAKTTKCRANNQQEEKKMKILENVDDNCCEVCNTDEFNNGGYFVPSEGRDVWLCEECAKEHNDEIE